MGIDSSLGVTSSAYTIGNYVNGVALNTSLATFTSNIVEWQPFFEQFYSEQKYTFLNTD